MSIDFSHQGISFYQGPRETDAATQNMLNIYTTGIGFPQERQPTNGTIHLPSTSLQLVERLGMESSKHKMLTAETRSSQRMGFLLDQCISLPDEDYSSVFSHLTSAGVIHIGRERQKFHELEPVLKTSDIMSQQHAPDVITTNKKNSHPSQAEDWQTTW